MSPDGHPARAPEVRAFGRLVRKMKEDGAKVPPSFPDQPGQLASETSPLSLLTQPALCYSLTPSLQIRRKPVQVNVSFASAAKAHSHLSGPGAWEEKSCCGSCCDWVSSGERWLAIPS
ncbi:unnamed protein product [Pipistrellus nathusii]|uniref:Uncharacterized protein n=1 Tax=Pipistrellus nathusii TaxID=59473 RepID=A0ABP0AG11_PIPNA